ARFAQLHAAMEKNYENRAELCKAELSFALARECEAGAIVDKLANGELPLRVTHNDTKLNNVLFDYDTRTPLCVIDLDTIMPGSTLYDYGDSIRFGASTAAEDEEDVSKISLDMNLFKAFTAGFLSEVRGFLPDSEIRLLPLGVKVITCELAMRFLTDYIDGDLYFKVRSPDHNLIRARAQMKLLTDIEAKTEDMNRIIEEFLA
ncbi:MAG: phosphotransferase, partial [Clostridia bacterium]|nr:phosphotransferase [Clostridia bacterium]